MSGLDRFPMPEGAPEAGANLSVVEHLLPGTMLGDAAAILGSVDIVVGETDR